MIKATLEPECTGQFSAFFLDYLHQKPSLKPFYNLFPSLENFKKAVQERSFSQEKREVLATALTGQYQKAGLECAAVEKLRDSKTFTVTTGHQLNLMTGPLYFIYKIVSTINLADRLNKEYPDFHFIPVYWMATEDHDFAEINNFNFDGEKYRWESQQTGAVGDFVLDGELKAMLKKWRFLPDFLREAYESSDNLATAVRKYVHHLFGEKGLVIVDGHDSELKKMFAPIMEADILEGKASELVQESTEQLEELGYKTQVYSREINFFYLDKGLRERIVKVGDAYEVLNTELKFTETELRQLIQKNPEKFSPNVIMRPVYQEVILPNLAYLGGPAEVVYWLQLKKSFDLYKVDFPLIMPRNFAMVIDANTSRKIERLGIPLKDIFMSFPVWKKAYVKQHSSHDLTLNDKKEALESLMDEMGMSVKGIHPTLETTSESTKTRMLKIMDHFCKKVVKAEEKNFSEDLGRMQAIKNTLFPKGVPQERYVNLLQFYLQDEQFIEKLFQHFDPLDFNYILLRY
ncbi:bacillithiol biosynthesis cysteine-adding enzyme BshC [Litoribacter alkaliphilus]|uniref:Putative cysteine ligase BshC n=1 Tax=Litoribacter ruber TaxID=702568 RepID=A0AAP2CH62_9BACT|nr:bacillithiol biosynthesis cysteine-adding enzyme BshC [Litoribacter alkaliphilus]MBS9523690.1 bacillithiol biosynthesis cysteine-adding enzyme BshC [Litoribacter alkaliphilus]